MLKKIALPVVALVVMLILTSAPAKAGVSFGVTVGPPVYTYPAYPYAYDPYAYANPYYDPYAYPGYGYYAPAPAFGYYNYGGWGRHEGHEFREHGDFRGHDRGSFGGNGFHGGGGHRR